MKEDQIVQALGIAGVVLFFCAIYVMAHFVIKFW